MVVAEDAQVADGLVPRLGNLPISNSSFFRSAVVTRLPEDPPAPTPPNLTLYGSIGGRHASAVTSLAFSPDGRLLASADADGTGVLWLVATLTPAMHELSGHQGAVTSLAFSSDGSTLATADAAGTVRFWDTATGARSHPDLPGVTSGPVGVRFVTDQTVLVGPVEGWIALVDVESGRVERNLITAQPGEYTALAVWSGDRGALRLAGGGSDGSVSSWSTARDGALPVSGTGRHAGEVTSLTFTPDGSEVVSGSVDGQRRRWNPDTGEALGAPVPTENGQLLALTYTAARALLVSVGGDDWFRVWADAGAPQFDDIIRPPGPAPHASRLRSAAAASAGDRFAIGAEDGSISLWHDDSRAVTRPLSLPTPDQAQAHTRPAEGVLLTHEQSWTMQGIARGELLYSVGLAPGEITQLAVTNHTQRVMQHSVDAVSQAEALSQRRDAAGELDEHEDAAAAEAAAGLSSQTTVSSTTAGGFSLLGMSAGGASTSATSAGVSFSSGTRRVSDEANQRVHQQTVDQARQVRSQLSASVREVSEADALELRTRVVANYNHMHALNLQYYEVVGVQRLTTRVIDAERLIFIPVRVVEMADPQQVADLVTRFPHELADTLRGLGLHGPAACVDYLALGMPNATELRNNRLAEVWAARAASSADLVAAETALTGATTASSAAELAVLEARDALRAAPDGLAARERLQRELRAAQELAASCRASRSEAALRLSDLRKRSTALDRVRDHLQRSLLHAGIARPEHDTTAPTLGENDRQLLLAEIGRVLLDHQLEVNQGLWLRTDPSGWSALLAGTSYQGEPLGPCVDPTPVAVTGNLVGFRWRFADPAAAALFRHTHLAGSDEATEALSVPTGGVFAEAVLGAANAADRIDISRYWDWKSSLPPILPTGIGPLQQPDGTAPPQAPAVPVAPAGRLDLGPPQFVDLSSGIGAVTGALTNPELFGDLSGMQTSAALATAALRASSSGAQESAALASDNFRRHLQLQQKLVDAVLSPSGPGDAGFDPTMAGAVLNANEDPASPRGGDRSAGSERPVTGAAAADGSGGLEVEYVRGPDDTDAPTGGMT